MEQPKVIELTTPEDWQRSHEALLSLRPRLSLETFLGNRAFCLEGGYRLFGLEVDGIIVSVAGITIRPHLVFYKQLEIEDFATHKDYQKKGYGLILLKWIIEFAKTNASTGVKLISRLDNKDAHSFYKKAEMNSTGLRFELQFHKTNA